MGKSRPHPGEELLSAFVDGETTPVETETVRRHLAACSSCADLLEQLRGVDEVIASPVALSCDAVLPLLSAELDGELDADLAPFVRQHAMGCATCRVTREAWRAADERVRGLGMAQPSHRVDAAIAAIVAPPAPAGRALPRAIPLGFAAVAVRVVAAILVVTVGISGSVLLTQSPEQRAIVPGEAIVAGAQIAVLDARTNTLYVLDPQTGVIRARDAGTDRAIAEVRLSGNPTALALDEEKGSLLVLDSSAKTVTEISTATHAVLRTDELAVSGTPTTISVDAANAKFVIGMASSTSTGEIAVVDASSRAVDSVQRVDVKPSLIVIDSDAGLTFVLGADSTAVLDGKTYQRVATLPGGGVGAAANGRGKTAVLTRVDGHARVVFSGTQAGPVDLTGDPLAITRGPNGTFAVLVDAKGVHRVVLVDTAGILGGADADRSARQLAYDSNNTTFVVLGPKGESLGTLNAASSFAQAPAPTTTPSASPSSSPSPSPSASASPSAPVAAVTARPTAPPVVPGLEQPIGARPLWPGTFYLDVDSIDGIVAFTGAGSRIWLVDKSGSVVALDLRTGGRTTLARLPSKPRRAYMSVSAGFVYIVDTEAQLLESVDVVLGTVRSRSMPFGSSIVGMDVAWDGRLWFASSAVGQLISFDPSADRFGSVNRYAAGRISAIYARSPNKIWFAYPRGKDAIVGSYDTRWGVVDERRIADAGEVSALQVDESETVWLASSSLGLLSLRGEQLTPSTAGAASYAAFASAADGTVLSLIVDNRGAGTMQTVERVTMPFPAAARGLFVDNSGRIWSANTANHGFYIVVRVIAP